MTRDDTLNLIAVMAAAWPWAEWDDPKIELWCSQIADLERDVAGEAMRLAIAQLDKPPAVAWLRKAAKAVARNREPFGLPESSEVPASKETALAGLAAARAALRGGAE